MHQILVLGWIPDRCWIVTESREQLLGPGVWASGSGPRFGSDYFAKWPPASEPTAMAHLRNDEVKETRVLTVVYNMTTPRRVASTLLVKVWECDVGVIVACPPLNWLQVQCTAVSTSPAWVTNAGVVAGTDSIETAIFHTLTC